MKAPPIVKVEWCPHCGREGPEATCPKCDRPTVDLGYRVGWTVKTSSYYSSLDTIPARVRNAA